MPPTSATRAKPPAVHVRTSELVSRSAWSFSLQAPCAPGLASPYRTDGQRRTDRWNAGTIAAMPAGHGFTFGPYRLDVHSRQLLRDEEPVAIGARQLDLLLILVSRAGQILSKDQLIEAAWKDVAVTDNSL